MYEQAESVRSPISNPDSGQTSGPPSQHPPVHQGGSRGRVRHGNGADKSQEEQEAASHTYEEAEAVKRYATYKSADRTYPGGASGRGTLCSFISSHRSCISAVIAVLLGLVGVGLAPLTFINKEDISQLSTTVDALKRHQDDMRQLPATVGALKRNQDNMSTTVGALKRDREDIRHLTATVDALKRDQDDIRQLTATVDALKRDRENMRQLSSTVDALKRGQDDMRQLSTTIDALKRDQDDIRQLTTTVDALKRDRENMRQLSSTVDALKRDQDNMRQLSTTIDALKCDQDDIRQLTTTVDALKYDLDKERSRTATLEQRLHEMSKTSAYFPDGYTTWKGSCYKAFNTKKTFSDAAAACVEDGGTLAMPRDAETNGFLTSLHNSVSDNNAFWFGLHDRREDGSFEWVDGSALGTYNSWEPGEPSNYRGRDDCVFYSASPARKDKWTKASCDARLYFICQAVPGCP